MLCRFQTIFQYRTLRQKLTPKSLLWCFWQGVTLDATPTHMHTYQHTNFPWCISKNVWEILLLCLDRLGGWKYLILRLSNCLFLTLLLMPHTQRRRQRGDVPCRKNCPPPGRRYWKAYYLSFVSIPCWNGRIRREQPWNELILPGGLTNWILTFKKLILTAKAQVIFRNHNPHQNCLKLYFSKL